MDIVIGAVVWLLAVSTTRSSLIVVGLSLVRLLAGALCAIGRPATPVIAILHFHMELCICCIRTLCTNKLCLKVIRKFEFGFC